LNFGDQSVIVLNSALDGSEQKTPSTNDTLQSLFTTLTQLQMVLKIRNSITISNGGSNAGMEPTEEDIEESREFMGSIREALTSKQNGRTKGEQDAITPEQKSMAAMKKLVRGTLQVIKSASTTLQQLDSMSCRSLGAHHLNFFQMFSVLSSSSIVVIISVSFVH
jgi:hypothetical protein